MEHREPRTLASAPTGELFDCRPETIPIFSLSMNAFHSETNTDTNPLPGHLPRLGEGAYRGRAVVHWTMTVRDRGTGWLDARFTTRFRWLLLHGCGRYEVACPVHCVMPDHVHLLLHGWSDQGDQKGFIRFLRKHSNLLLAETDHRWQPQAHDHVLRPHESDRHAYERLVRYIAENPVRAGLVTKPSDWPHNRCGDSWLSRAEVVAAGLLGSVLAAEEVEAVGSFARTRASRRAMEHQEPPHSGEFAHFGTTHSGECAYDRRRLVRQNEGLVASVQGKAALWRVRLPLGTER